MIIHVVQPGESLWQIAAIYGVSVQTLINANGLQSIPYLITGQALVIPVTSISYTIQPGDSLWGIAQRYGVTVDEIIALNNITNPALVYPGMVIRVPLRPDRYGTIEVNGFITPTPDADRALMRTAGPYLTYVSPFSYAVQEDGTLTTLADETVIAAARQYNVAPMLVITNYRGGNFDAELAHTILANENIQQTLVRNLIILMRAKGYYGVNIDFERIPPADRQLYNEFLRRVTAVLHAENFIVSTALAPKTYDITTGAWHGAHDYRAHGQIVDFVVIMTYDWGWAGGPPYAIAPIPEVRKVLDYAVSVIPREKIMMGVPFYGYDWTLPYTPDAPWASMVSNTMALQRAATYGAVIRYNSEVQSPYFEYIDTNGRQHIVWFEDARSLQAKYNLVREYGLRGVSYWVLNLPMAQNWPVLDYLFNIRKLT